jgi:hypothetical protein
MLDLPRHEDVFRRVESSLKKWKIVLVGRRNLGPAGWHDCVLIQQPGQKCLAAHQRYSQPRAGQNFGIFSLDPVVIRQPQLASQDCIE